MKVICIDTTTRSGVMTKPTGLVYGKVYEAKHMTGLQGWYSILLGHTPDTRDTLSTDRFITVEAYRDNILTDLLR